MRITVDQIIEKKQKNQKITMLTAYDYSFAGIVDEAGIDIILVGDSLANVVLGMESTVDITLEEMLNHAQAVSKGSKNALIVGDMPYCAFQKDPSKALINAKKFISVGCQAVKLEWFQDIVNVTKEIVSNNIPVMGHIGFTPQTADLLGKSKIQGKDLDGAKRLIEQAIKLDELGCFSIVLECIPWQISEIITKKIKIPTIGIGAGNQCDGQVLVLNDLLGTYRKFRPKFVKVYEDIYEKSVNAIKKYKQEVENSIFPSSDQSFSMKDEEFERIKQELYL